MNHPPNDQQSLTGTVLNIQHFSIHDGPGMRTTVFLKGCSFRCKWCSNPESIHPKPELAYKLNACIGTKECGFCLKECPESAIFTVDSDVKVRINWDLWHQLQQVRAGLSAQSALHVRRSDDSGPGHGRGRAGQRLLP